MSEEEFTSIKRWLINISAPLLPAGKKEELEIAEKLLAKDMEVVEIMEITGLDKDKIEEIKNKAQH